MGQTAKEVRDTKTEISALQARILLLQENCSHSFKVIAQQSTENYRGDNHVTLQCVKCEKTDARVTSGSWCEEHATEMHRAFDEEGKKQEKECNQEQRDKGSLYSALAFKCPVSECSNRKVTLFWDK